MQCDVRLTPLIAWFTGLSDWEKPAFGRLSRLVSRLLCNSLLNCCIDVLNSKIHVCDVLLEYDRLHWFWYNIISVFAVCVTHKLFNKYFGIFVCRMIKNRTRLDTAEQTRSAYNGEGLALQARPSPFKHGCLFICIVACPVFLMYVW